MEQLLQKHNGRLLKKYSDKIVISYDSDGAGQAATLRGLDILTDLGCDVRILQIEGAKDPDEFVIKYGKEKFYQLVKNAKSLVEFKAKMLKKDLDLQNINDKIKFLKQIAKLLSKVDSKIEQELYLDKIAKDYDVSKEAIYAEINKITSKGKVERVLEKSKPVKLEKIEKKITPTEEKRENLIIALLIKDQKEVYKKIKDKIYISDIKSETNKVILGKLFKILDENKVIINALDLFEDDKIKSKISEILLEDYELENEEKGIEDIINIYEKERLINRKNEIIQKIAVDNSVELEKELQEVIKKLTLMNK